MATRKDATTGRPHQCRQGCPGKGEALTDDQASEAYAHHRAELEAVVQRMLAGHKGYAARFRPRWWWLFHDEAADYRADPSAFEDARDFTASDVPMEPWITESIHRREVEKMGKLRFLARAGLLEDWEIQHTLSGGGLGARVLKEELARGGSR
jgi:hypothetical protein